VGVDRCGWLSAHLAVLILVEVKNKVGSQLFVSPAKLDNFLRDVRSEDGEHAGGSAQA
jgi:hypothetical protein